MSSSTPTDQAALKVFGIPELAYIICADFRKRDKASLMQVCRPLFYRLLPVIWKEVDEPDALVSMIPGGGLVYYHSDSLPYVVMELPGSLDLSRFNLYAPHVKRLTISPIHVDEYDGWENFLTCTRTIDLLPNLETLCLPAPKSRGFYSTNGAQKVEADSVKWIIAFLSTSLQNLVLAPSRSDDTHDIQYTSTHWLDFSLFNSLMASVTQKCSHLRSLSILPANSKQPGMSSRRYRPHPQISFSPDYPGAFSNLFQLGNLTSLLVSAAFLRPEAFATLSGLPQLESLCIVGGRYDYEVRCNDLQLPIEAFPALKHLEVNQINWNTVANLCNAKPVVTRLRSVTITSSGYSNINSGEDGYQSLSDIITILASSNSSITTLNVYDCQISEISPEVLNSWSRLPLVNLHLEWIMFNYCGFDVLYSIISRLPLLETLRISMYRDPLDLKQLRQIVDILPRLRRAQIPVKWGAIFELSRRDFTPCRSESDKDLYLKSDFYLPQPQTESAERLARFLSMLRPMAHVICESNQAEFYHDDTYGYIDQGPKDMINVELSRLRPK